MTKPQLDLIHCRIIIVYFERIYKVHDAYWQYFPFALLLRNGMFLQQRSCFRAVGDITHPNTFARCQTAADKICPRGRPASTKIIKNREEEAPRRRNLISARELEIRARYMFAFSAAPMKDYLPRNNCFSLSWRRRRLKRLSLELNNWPLYAKGRRRAMPLVRPDDNYRYLSSSRITCVLWQYKYCQAGIGRQAGRLYSSSRRSTQEDAHLRTKERLSCCCLLHDEIDYNCYWVCSKGVAHLVM